MDQTPENGKKNTLETNMCTHILLSTKAPYKN